MKEYNGHFTGKGLRIAIIASRFNGTITQNLLAGALDCLKRHGVIEDHITVIWVPGAYEIPFMTKRLALTNAYDALICLGAVIRGATPHFDYVAGHAASGIAQVGMETGIPTVFGVLTTNTIEEAIERSGTKSGNKGFDAAASAIEMADLLRQLGTI